MSASIWVIIYNSRSYDWDNRRTCDERIEEEEGFFTSEAAAQQRVVSLNAWAEGRWREQETAKQQGYDAQLAGWEEQERQREFLIANGYAPGPGSNPPVKPQALTYEDWLWRDGGVGTYEALELKVAPEQLSRVDHM